MYKLFNRKYFKHSFVLLIIAIVFSGVRLFVGSPSFCVYRIISGLPCPGCGLTSATFALFRGDIIQSFKYHPFLLVAYFSLLTFLLQKVKPFSYLYKLKLLWLIILILFIALFIARLIIYFPNGPYPMEYIKENLIAKIYMYFR